MDDASTKLKDTLLEESDRGLVLAGAGFLDHALRELLAAAVRCDLSKKDIEKIFERGGPLNSLWSRTLVAYALRLIDDKMRISLDRLRDIRNHFAHYAGITPLPATEIDDLLGLGEPSLKLAVVAIGNSEDAKFSDPRVKISLCIVSLWAKIKHRSEELEKL